MKQIFFNLVFSFLALTGATDLEAGIIRDVYMDSKKMQPVYLQLGQSTVLRFKEKPKKVVVGNQNYYSIEFVDSDVTIQPLGAVSTNLFVYGKSKVYGFILHVGRRSRYDDLLNIHWNYRRSFLIKPKEKKPKRATRPKESKIYRSFSVSGIDVFVEKIWLHGRLGSYVVDAKITNKRKESVKTKDLKIDFTRSNRSLPHQEHVFEKNEIPSGESIRVRSLVKIPSKRGFSYYLNSKGQRKRIIVSRRLL